MCTLFNCFFSASAHSIPGLHNAVDNCDLIIRFITTHLAVTSTEFLSFLSLSLSSSIIIHFRSKCFSGQTLLLFFKSLLPFGFAFFSPLPFSFIRAWRKEKLFEKSEKRKKKATFDFYLLCKTSE